MPRQFVPRPARLELTISQAPAFRLRLENEHARRVLEALRLVRSCASDLLDVDVERVRDEDVADCLCAIIWQALNHQEVL